MEQARDRLVREASETTSHRQAELRAQAQALTQARDMLHTRVREVEASLTCNKLSQTISTSTALEQALGSKEVEGLLKVSGAEVGYEVGGEEGGVVERLVGYVCKQLLVRFVACMGSQEERQLQSPHQLAVDADHVYVVNWSNHNVPVLDKHSLMQTRVVRGALDKPVYGVAVDDTRLYMSQGYAVSAVDKASGEQVWRTGIDERGVGKGQFYFPQHVVVDWSHVYVADDNTHRVVVLDKDTGCYVRSLGGLRYPYGLTLDPEKSDLLYLSDKGDHCVKVLHKETGQLRWQIDRG